MHIMVTGAAGFVGSRVARRLLEDEHEVTGIDALTPYYDPEIKRRAAKQLTGLGGDRFRLVRADLSEPGWEHHLDDVDVVLHQAGQPGVRASWSGGFATYVQHNVLATQRLLEAVRDRAGTSRAVRRIVYASSSSVYGDALRLPTPETSLPAPRSPYGVTKLAAEHLCAAYSAGFGVDTVTLRYFTVYGAGQRPDMALHRMIMAAHQQRPFPRFGDGRQERDLTHVDDVAAANVAAMTAPVAPGSVYNIAGGSRASLQQLLDLVGDAVGTPVPIDPQPEQAGDVRRTGGDTTAARAALRWAPRVDLGAGIAEQVKSLLGGSMTASGTPQ